MPYSQDSRILAIQTTLGADAAILTELEGVERISEPFLFKIRFATGAKADDVSGLLGTAVSIEFGLNIVQRRKLHGHIRRLRRGSALRNGEYEWHAEIVPMLWFLSRTSDCRIFQDKTIPDIIDEVLKLHGVTSFELKLTGSYQPREYVVQYRESALDFIQRLMEQEGIFYWHEHSASGHKLVLADASTVSTPKQSTSYGMNAGLAEVSVYRFEEEIVVRSGKWTLRDFNFKTPSTLLEASEPTTIDVAEMKKRERYDYPGIYEQKSAGTGVARHRIENEETFHKVLSGNSGISDFLAGARVQVSEASVEGLLLTEVRHEAQDTSHWTDEAWAERESLRGGKPRDRSSYYFNDFVAIPSNVKFRPERVTPRPFVQGPQTAVVTGPSGEEIHTDEFGRVKVQFHWDRLGEKDEHTSCWIRVSQGWAGQGWGQMHIPRIGHEVIVDFLEGDPDRPIITGRVYNAENMYPYPLPGDKTRSGIKTNSSKGGGGANEIRFEDKKGAEEIFVNAEHDLNTIVENNETRQVGTKGIGDRTTDIKNDELTRIKGNKTTEVTKDFKETITGSETRTVTKDVTETLLANETRTITGNQNETVMTNITQIVGGTVFQSITGSHTQQSASSTVIALASITLVAPSIKQIGPSWFKTGMAAGDAYVFKTGTAAIKNDNSGLSLNVGAVKIDNFGLKLDNFGFSIKTGGIEIKNKALKVNSEAFAAKRGMKFYSA